MDRPDHIIKVSHDLWEKYLNRYGGLNPSAKMREVLYAHIEEPEVEPITRPADRSKWTPAMSIDCMLENGYTGQNGGAWQAKHEEVITGINPITKIKTNNPFREKTIEEINANEKMKNLWAAVLSKFEEHMRINGKEIR